MKAKRLAKAFDVVSVPLDQIVDNPDQPRTIYNDGSIQELAKSIEDEGLLQPIAVRHLGKGKYRVEFGSRRVRAFRHLGRKVIPAIVLEEDESMIVSLAENIQREDLPIPDEARAFKKICDLTNLTQTQLAEKIGKDKSYVNRMVKMGGVVEEYLAKGVAFTKLSKSAYAELLDTPELLGKAEAENWKEKKCREMVQEWKQRGARPDSEKQTEQVKTHRDIEFKPLPFFGIAEDPAKWEPTEEGEEGFTINSFRLRKNSKVDIELVCERIHDLQNKLEHILEELRRGKWQTELPPEDSQEALLFSRDTVQPAHS
jgi:ParB/RepB/Spo0J family partition protein